MRASGVQVNACILLKLTWTRASTGCVCVERFDGNCVGCQSRPRGQVVWRLKVRVFLQAAWYTPCRYHAHWASVGSPILPCMFPGESLLPLRSHPLTARSYQKVTRRSTMPPLTTCAFQAANGSAWRKLLRVRKTTLRAKG